jgi:hypothetical protein
VKAVKEVLALALVSACTNAGLRASPDAASSIALKPATMARIGTITDRYQSYNVEMLEVTGGRFWRPYGPKLEALLKTKTPAASSGSGGNTPAGMNPGLYAYRPPLDLTNARRRKLAAALGPAYVRISGTWANTTYFPDSDTAMTTPPTGFAGVLTRQQWKGVVDFSHAVNAEIVTSFATGVGTRDSGGSWTPDQARRFLSYTESVGGSIAAAEFMNEPTLAAMGGAPAGYDAKAYARDFEIFHAFARQRAPGMLVLGPGSVGETTGDWSLLYGLGAVLPTRDLLAATSPGVDAFSYHHYGASSQRCAGAGVPGGTSAEDALSEGWLRRTDETLSFYRGLRDEFEPSKPFWVTETADAACGGNPWASTFLDSFRYLDQLGRLAKQGVQVVMHNTLDASDYGLMDEDSLLPRPNYWAALLWRRFMGPTVLESGVPIKEGLHLYAHSLRGHAGGVALLVINNSRTQPVAVDLSVPSERYTLTSQRLDSGVIEMNGRELRLGPQDTLPDIEGKRTPAGRVEFAPASITFLAITEAGNASSK